MCLIIICFVRNTLCLLVKCLSQLSRLSWNRNVSADLNTFKTLSAKVLTPYLTTSEAEFSGKTKEYGEKNQSYRHFVYYIFHSVWPGIEPVLLRTDLHLQVDEWNWFYSRTSVLYLLLILFFITFINITMLKNEEIP